jgi:hypothetical protein
VIAHAQQPERHECPHCHAPYLGTVVDSDHPVWDREAQEFKINREFPCFHCEHIVCWWQVCSIDGDPVRDRSARRGFGLLKAKYYSAWMARHDRHAELEVAEI